MSRPAVTNPHVGLPVTVDIAYDSGRDLIVLLWPAGWCLELPPSEARHLAKLLIGVCDRLEGGDA